MAKKIKVAVVGVGNMGGNHARIYASLPLVDFVGVCDIDGGRGRRIAKKYGIKFYRNYEQIQLSEKPELVSICVPTSLHFEVANFFLKRKTHVLLEKPIAKEIAEAQTLVKLAKKNKLILFTGHTERFNPAVAAVKEMIDKGDLGRIIAVAARRVGGFPPQITDADIAIDLAIHDIDIINYLLNDLPIKISVNRQRSHIEKRDDSVEFFLRYKKASAYIQANWITPVKIRRLTITGTEGYLEMDYVSQKIEFYKSNYNKFRQTFKDFSDFILVFSQPDKIDIAVARKEPLKEEIVYVLDCLAKNKIIDSRFAVEALKIAATT